MPLEKSHVGIYSNAQQQLSSVKPSLLSPVSLCCRSSFLSWTKTLEWNIWLNGNFNSSFSWPILGSASDRDLKFSAKVFQLVILLHLQHLLFPPTARCWLWTVFLLPVLANLFLQLHLDRAFLQKVIHFQQIQTLRGNNSMRRRLLLPNYFTFSWSQLHSPGLFQAASLLSCIFEMTYSSLPQF